MTVLEPTAQPASDGNDDDFDLVHTACCRDPELALCGADLTDAPEGRPTDLECVTCHHEDNAGTCPLHGRCPDDDRLDG